MKRSERVGMLLVLASGALWGSIGLFVKELAGAGASPEYTSFLRMLSGSVIMAVLSLAVKGPKAFMVTKKTLFMCMIMGFVCQGIYNVCYSVSVRLNGMSAAVVLLYLSPIFTMAFSMGIFKEHLSGKKALGLVINVIGCILTVTNGSFDLESLILPGILCGVGAGFCYGLTPIIGRFATEDADPFAVTAYNFLFGALFLGLFMRPWEGNIVINEKVILWGALFGLIPTACSYLLYFCGLRMIKESSRIPIIASAEVVVAAVIGISIYGEKIGPAGIAGIALVVISIAIINFKKKPILNNRK